MSDTRVCGKCAREYEPIRPTTQLFCSAACRLAFHKEKRAREIKVGRNLLAYAETLYRKREAEKKARQLTICEPPGEERNINTW